MAQAKAKGPGLIGQFFTIYKRGQGKWVRWGTVAGMAIIVVTGVDWLVMNQMAAMDILPRLIAGLSWVVVWALVTFWAVNSPKLAEFMIMTESEMRKVSWPSRRDVINWTKVVIILTVLLGVLLWLVDIGFVELFKGIKLS